MKNIATMSDELNDIQKQIRRRQGLEEDEDQRSWVQELKDTILGLLISLMIGYVLIFGLAGIISLFNSNQFFAVANGVAIGVAIIGIIWIYLSISAGAGNFTAEMTRRAWTTSQRNDKAFDDFRNLANFGAWSQGVTIAAISVVLMYYFLFL